MLTLLALLSEILSIVFFLIFLKRNNGEGVWIIFLYCIFSAISEPIGVYMKQKMGPFYFYAIFTILEYTIFAFFFYVTLKKKKIWYVPLVGTLLFYGIAAINFTHKNAENFDSLSASVESILVIIYSLLFLYDQIRHSSDLLIYNTKKFWIVIALFLYFSSTLFLFLFASKFTKQEHSNYWVINNFFEILKNTLFCISFAMKKTVSDHPPIKTFNPDYL